MTYNVLMGTANLTHTLTHSLNTIFHAQSTCRKLKILYSLLTVVISICCAHARPIAANEPQA